MIGASELRIVITVDDFERAVRFYRDTVGLDVEAEWDREEGRGTIFDVGKATIEIFDRDQKRSNDLAEAGRVVEGDVRMALKVDDIDTAFHRLVVDGAPMMAHPFDAPWGQRVARLQTPHGMQLTLFSDA